MGRALEIGRVNKERGIVSFTWLIPLTSLFALLHSLSHAPCLILYFSHATYTSPFPSFLLPPLLSLPPLLPFCSSFSPNSLSHGCPSFFEDYSRTLLCRMVHPQKTQEVFFHSVFSAPVCAYAKLWYKQVNFLIRLYDCLSVSHCNDCIALNLNQRHCCLDSVSIINKQTSRWRFSNS